ncbi:MAG TPA: hypothetical protein EYG10_07020 [Gammaproteobacteria bacterium]|nr:hypothetical protein [Gammaproteobacteria bacterium]
MKAVRHLGIHAVSPPLPHPEGNNDGALTRGCALSVISRGSMHSNSCSSWPLRVGLPPNN